MWTPEVFWEGGDHPEPNSSEGVTASADWSWQVFGKMICWKADGISRSLPDSYSHCWFCSQHFPGALLRMAGIGTLAAPSCHMLLVRTTTQAACSRNILLQVSGASSHDWRSRLESNCSGRTCIGNQRLDIHHARTVCRYPIDRLLLHVVLHEQREDFGVMAAHDQEDVQLTFITPCSFRLYYTLNHADSQGQNIEIPTLCIFSWRHKVGDNEV